MFFCVFLFMSKNTISIATLRIKVWRAVNWNARLQCHSHNVLAFVPPFPLVSLELKPQEQCICEPGRSSCSLCDQALSSLVGARGVMWWLHGWMVLWTWWQWKPTGGTDECLLLPTTQLELWSSLQHKSSSDVVLGKVILLTVHLSTAG